MEKFDATLFIPYELSLAERYEEYKKQRAEEEKKQSAEKERIPQKEELFNKLAKKLVDMSVENEKLRQKLAEGEEKWNRECNGGLNIDWQIFNGQSYLVLEPNKRYFVRCSNECSWDFGGGFWSESEQKFYYFDKDGFISYYSSVGHYAPINF